VTADDRSGAGPGCVLGSAFAPAKVNLALHVTGRRTDGYHRLDSLVAFAAIGDTIEAIADPAATEPSLAILGPFAAGLAVGPENLVLRAARAHAAAGGRIDGLTLRLTKRLPVASGIGGGSADAAATLRLLGAISTLPGERASELPALAASLGADVPMCLLSTPARASGIGEILEPVSALPALPMLLVNPGIAVSTPAVFQRLERADNPALPPIPSTFADMAAVAEWLRATRNDLEAPAIAALPPIADVIARVDAEPECLLARMSGSGATVFGLFPDTASVDRAAARIRADHPTWWVVSTRTAAS
jgi:4-diphosphocytidyl-2-C-methyl-D-erythritol kinase